MADFKAGDRVVKMSGAAAGKYGTVNSVREDGTLNVTFDGERLPRYCDPMRCGRVAANAAGDKREYYVVDAWGNKADGSITPLPFDRASALFLKLTGSKRGNGKWGISHKDDPIGKARDWFGNIVAWDFSRNSRAANAKFKVGDKVRSKTHRNVDVLRVRGVQEGETFYDVEVTDGPKWARVKGRLPESDLVAANSRTANAVARNFTEDQLRKYLTYRYYSYKGKLYFTPSPESAPVWVLHDDKREGEKWDLRACKNRGVEAVLSKAHPEWNFCQVSDLQRKQNEEAKIRKIVEAELRKMGKTI